MFQLLQIQNLDSFRKVIVDSIISAQRQQLNTLDYINKVDSFYNNAWTKLAIVFGLVGVLIPLVINYIQLKKNEADKEIIKSALKTELKSEIDEYLQNEISKIQHASEGVSYQIQSDILFDKQKFRESFGGTVNAMTCYLIGEDYCNYMNAMEDLYIRFKEVTKADIESICIEYSEYYDINSLIKRMEDAKDDKYSYHLTKLKATLAAIT